MGGPPRGLWWGMLLGVGMGVLGARVLAPQTMARPQSPPAEPASTALRQHNATLQQLQAIDRGAQVTLREQIARLTAQNGELNRRLALLRGVLLSDGQAPELGVADLALMPQADGTRFGYRLLLARAASAVPAPTAAKLVGRVQLWLVGAPHAQDIRVAESRLALQHLQALSGVLALPAGFHPQRLRVVVEPSGQASQVFEFAWQELVLAGQPMKAATPLP